MSNQNQSIYGVLKREMEESSEEENGGVSIKAEEERAWEPEPIAASRIKVEQSDTSFEPVMRGVKVEPAENDNMERGFEPVMRGVKVEPLEERILSAGAPAFESDEKIAEYIGHVPEKLMWVVEKKAEILELHSSVVETDVFRLYV